MRDDFVLISPDLFLGEDDYILDESNGMLSVPTDLFDCFVKDTYVNISFAGNNAHLIYPYKMIDMDDEYIKLEYIGG